MIPLDGVPLDDRGLLLGDGLFETVLARAGDLVALTEHLERMAAGCAILGLAPPDPAAAEALIRQALAEAGLETARAAVRLTLTAGSGGRGLDRPATPAPRLFATAAASQPPATPARLVTSTIRRNADSPASRLKTLAYLDNVLARREATQAGADEALMLNTRGEVAGAAAANLFWIQGEALFTPALECGVLAGIARAKVMARAEAMGVQTVRVRARPEELARAQAIFLTNSLIGVRPVSAVDGAVFSPSPLMEQLAEAMA